MSISFLMDAVTQSPSLGFVAELAQEGDLLIACLTGYGEIPGWTRQPTMISNECVYHRTVKRGEVVEFPFPFYVYRPTRSIDDAGGKS